MNSWAEIKKAEQTADDAADKEKTKAGKEHPLPMYLRIYKNKGSARPPEVLFSVRPAVFIVALLFVHE